MSGYTGMSGAQISELMHGAMEAAVLKTAKRVEVTAKKYAPVRKVFKEKGRARMEKRTFIDTGLPANLRKKGSRASKPVERTVMVRSHRANRMSTSSLSRQDFVEVSQAEATTTRLKASGERVRELKPGVIAHYARYEKDDNAIPTYYKLSDEAYSKLSSRGRYEVANAGRLHQASIDEGRNVSPRNITVTEPYVPGKLGGYPRGAKLSSDGTTISFKRRSGRQVVIRVRNEKSIRAIVSTAAKNSKRTPEPVFTGKALKPNPKGGYLVEGTRRKASAHQEKVWKAHQAKVAEVKKKNRAVDDTFGGLNSRTFASTMTPFSEKFGSFKGAKFGTHFNLQVGGHLRESITSVPTSRTAARISAGVYYAIYQEFGTSHHPAHPFLRPALHESRGTLLANAADKGRRAVQNMRKG